MTLCIPDIAERIPHRHQNLLLDSCTVFEDESQFELTINKDDDLSRDIFLTNLNEKALVPPSVLAEASALACIVSAGKIPKGSFAYFAGITNFSLTGACFDAAFTIKGHTKKISGKHGFYKYSCHLQNESGAIAQAQLMAYYDSSGSSEATNNLQSLSLPNTIEFALTVPGEPVTPYAFKQPKMTFVDTCNLTTNESSVYSYQYPLDHPLIRGHFPGNPVMMGICQWQMLEDAMTHYVNHHYNAGSSPDHLTCNALIMKSNRTPVCDIKGATIRVNPMTIGYQAHIELVKKVLFKQKVVPGDTLYIHISHLP
jgi:3-hydroxymyristoyl/3-hydroxydecanoyl-(acyl carrier protein) dehydratase